MRNLTGALTVSQVLAFTPNLLYSMLNLLLYWKPNLRLYRRPNLRLYSMPNPWLHSSVAYTAAMNRIIWACLLYTSPSPRD